MEEKYIPEKQVPYYVIDDEWVGFDNPRSIREKVNLNVLLMHICNSCDKDEGFFVESYKTLLIYMVYQNNILMFDYRLN